MRPVEWWLLAIFAAVMQVSQSGQFFVVVAYCAVLLALWSSYRAWRVAELAGGTGAKE